MLCVALTFLIVGMSFGRGAIEQGDASPYASYRDIPGVTDEEIRAVEALKEQGRPFVYGMLYTSEAFSENGEIRGFAALLCDWLSELFGIPFAPAIHDWDVLLAGLQDHSIDFTGELSATDERRKIYFMTGAIANRSIKHVRIEGSAPLRDIAARRPLRYAFLDGSITDDRVAAHVDYPFEKLYVDNYDSAYRALKSGEADAFFIGSNVETAFDAYDDAVAEYFFPMIRAPVSMTTQNHTLEPVISVVQKALQNGGAQHLSELYKLGWQEYQRHKLYVKLNEEERAYLRSSPAVLYLAEHYAYPASFYNAYEKEWQGIFFDMLKELKALTGLSFELANDMNTSWVEMLGMLESGEAAMIADLIPSKELEDRLLWSETMLLTDYYALLSKSETSNVSIDEVMNAKVGLPIDTAYAKMFRSWFPDHANTVDYDLTVIFAALERGEVDMVMSSHRYLLALMNYNEFSGYKANLTFNYPLDYTIGFNRDEVILRSIVDKALRLIDVKGISDQWTHKTYDYKARLAREQRPWLVGSVVVLTLIIALLIFIYLKDRKASKTIAGQAATLTAIYDSIPAIVFTQDLDNRYTSLNSKFLEEARVGKEQLLGKSFKDVELHDQSVVDEFFQTDKKVISENTAIRTEGWYNYVDGSRRAKEIIRTPLIQNNKVVGLLGIAMDITERKSAEEALREAHERETVMLDTIPLCSLLINRNYECIDCNNEAARIFELNNKQEFIEHFNRLSPEYQPDGRHSLETAATIIDRAFEGERFVGEWTHQLLDGTPIPAITTFERVKYGDDYIVFSYMRDMREYKRMTAKIETIMSNLPGMVFQQLYDPPIFTYTFVSEGCKELTGYAPGELMNGGSINLAGMIHPDDAEYVKQLSEATIPCGLPFEATFRIITKDGETKWIWERSRVIGKNQDGSPHLIEGYQTDVTERQQLEEAETANRAKSEFLATMSHEIRTPMNSIMGFAELASDSDSVPQMKDFLEKISDSTKWLLHIINDILDISKIESGKMELDNTPFDLRDVFSRCQSVILPIIKEKGLDLSIYAEPSIGRRLMGDPVRLYQVLMNLLSNAVKFTQTGTIKFSSSIKSAANGSATVYFEIKDTGIGMTAEQMDKVFGLFIQADSSTTRDYGGTGLGLAIAKNIVELMGGKLAVESAPGVGSVFSFEITFETIEAPEDTPDRTKYEMLERPCFDGLVLICDDNSLNQQVICAHLARVGLKTMAAENGKLGVEIVKERKEKNEKPFDLIFMDMFMPVMDGMEAAAQIMAMNTGTPIVAMTANVMVSELEKYKRAGMPDCLGKPFTSQELWRMLLTYLAPVGSDPISGVVDENEEHEELQKKLRINFFNDNQTIHTEILAAVAAGDTKLAHRLAHSLKGSAGLIGKTALKNAAAEVEALLKEGLASVWENKMNILTTELMSVLDELRAMFAEPVVREQPRALSAEQTLTLLARLEPMLESNNTDCMDLLHELRAVPGAEALLKQIDNFDFKSAARTLIELKKEWENIHE